ncbi:hypothetical protein BpHYR1_036091 [Brachionus plicatilis]|uniref:C-type lectin domain-containing protein n=1 Tax=Brachionus plicatilis TaxID=10195 RepID=A0A3M7REF6_BRAPC|nr:hypothetical protein BpHYR1_036091 [Brachionus plicatilis]
MKSIWQIMMMVTFLMNFKPNFCQNMNQFEKLLINGSTDLTVSEQFRGAYSFYTVQGLSLLKCASFCSINNNCLIFSIKKSENNSECEFFSSQNLDESEIISKSYSSVYRKKVIQSNINQCRDMWLPFKSICYRAFPQPKTWQEYVDYCSSLNSSLLIADDNEKFQFFQSVSRDLSAISGYQRTWVYARYDTINVFNWMNLNPLNASLVSGVTTFNGCFGYYTFPNSLLDISGCFSSTSGICEYSNV